MSGGGTKGWRVWRWAGKQRGPRDKVIKKRPWAIPHRPGLEDEHQLLPLIGSVMRVRSSHALKPHCHNWNARHQTVVWVKGDGAYEKVWLPVGTKKLHLMGIRNAVSGIYDSRQLFLLHLPLPVCLLQDGDLCLLRPLGLLVGGALAKRIILENPNQMAFICSQTDFLR